MGRVIWLSDVHYMSTGEINAHDTRLRLSAALDAIVNDFGDADAVLISGDLTEDGTPEDYAGLAKHLSRLPMPVLTLIGNHDVRPALQAALPNGSGSFRHFTHEIGDDVILALDTFDGLSAPGRLCPERMAWIRDALDRFKDRRVLVAMHHPPVRLGLPNQDQDRVVEGDQLMDLLADHGRVAHVLCGHVHRSIQTFLKGIPVTAARAVSYQAPAMRPEWDWDSFIPSPEAPSFAIVDLDPDAVRIHQHAFCAADFGIVA